MHHASSSKDRRKNGGQLQECVYIYIYTRIGNPLMTTNAVYIHVYFGRLAHTYTFILMGSTTVTWNERIMTGNSWMVPEDQYSINAFPTFKQKCYKPKVLPRALFSKVSTCGFNADESHGWLQNLRSSKTKLWLPRIQMWKCCFK